MGLFVCLVLLWPGSPYAVYPPSAKQGNHSTVSPIVPCYTCLAYAVRTAIRNTSVDPPAQVTLVLSLAFDLLCPAISASFAVLVLGLPPRVLPVLWVAYSSRHVGCVECAGCSPEIAC
jgi:hypothetical protein